MGRVTALVTGASSGIGLRYAKELTNYGYNLIIVSNQENEIKETAHKIAEEVHYHYLDESNFANAMRAIHKVECNTPIVSRAHWITSICKDLSQPSAAQELFDFCNSNNIEVEVLVNNAGMFFFKDILDCSAGRISTILTLHMYTVTMLCRLFGERMRDRKKGYILNMSSISVHTPYPGISLYTATKSYIRTMTKAFRLELKEYGVRVMAVSPGAVATDLYNLPPNLQQLGVNLGIIYKPDKLAKKAIGKLFYSNRKEYVPGVVNHLFKPIYSILPECFKMWARRKIQRYMN